MFKKQAALIMFLLLSIVMVVNSYGQVSVGAVIFMLIEPGSRAGGMGNANTAIADDGTTAWWNPGRMAFMKEKANFSWMHSNWFGDVPGLDDMYYEYGGYIDYDDELGSYGFSFTYLTYGEQQSTDHAGRPGEPFTSYEAALAASYATELEENIGFGLTIKFIISDLVPESISMGTQKSGGRGQSFAVDFGYAHEKIIDMRDEELGYVDFGVSVVNIGPEIAYVNNNQADPMPTNLKIGLSYTPYEDEFFSVKTVLDINKLLVQPSDKREDFYYSWLASLFDESFGDEMEHIIYNMGAEATYYNMISGRIGYVYDDEGEIKGYSFGGGFKLDVDEIILSFDFAFQPGGQMLDGDFNKTFSLNAQF